MTWVSQRAAVLMGLIALDLASKITAYNLLPKERSADAADLFHFELAVNPTGLGSGAREILRTAQGQSPVLFGAMFAAGFAICLFSLKYFGKLTFWKAALGALVILCALFVVSWFKLFPALTPETSVRVLRGSQAILWCEVWVLAASTPWSAGTTFFAATAVGNFLSFLYPPYAIVDFMWSSVVHHVAGMNIFNCADLMWLCGVACFIFAFVSLAIRRIRRVSWST